MFVEDIKIRDFVNNYYVRVGISKVVIRKTSQEAEIIIFTSKPALVLWKDAKILKTCEEKLQAKFWKKFKLVVKEVRVPELSAKIMSEYFASQVEWRTPYRRVAKQMLERIMEKWALWIKIQIGWRLNGADISRAEKFSKWRIPLQTLRADIDYHHTIAMTKYWVLWIKVWICKWEVFGKNIG